MNLVLGRKEFCSLLEALEIADWVLHAYKAEAPAETRPFRELEQKVLALAASFADVIKVEAPEGDLIRQIGEPALQKLEFDERERREDPYRRLYGEEFLSHGVDRLEILQLRSGQGGESGKLLS